MHFKIAKSAQSYFNNIMNLEGSHAAEDKNTPNVEFSFDVAIHIKIKTGITCA